MRRIIAALIIGVVALFGLTAPAQALPSDQRVCVSKYSSGGGVVADGKNIGVSDCKKVNRYGLAMVHGSSYKVKYNKGKYSNCRHNTWVWFDAYNKPSKITFKTYNRPNCQVAL